ncbi:MAG TPA: hypothetical protein VFK43_00625 [Acidimicrobiales bacterium]|nr:hypothetical protein [Acidimicrobiales bacterium]
MTTLSDLQTQVHELEGKALDYVKSAQAPVVEYVAKAATTLADVLPADKPELLVAALNGVTFQAGFAKQVLDTEVAFAKAVIDAAVKPFAPKKAKTVKAA